MTFDETWSRIRGLGPDRDVPKWSSTGRVQGSFTVASVDAQAVLVRSDGINGERRIPKESFANVLEVWDGYRSGVIPRSRVNKITRNSTYILGILHQIEKPS